MSTWNEDGWSLNNPSLDVSLLLLVDYHEVISVQLDGILHYDAVHLKSVHEHFPRPEQVKPATLNNNYYVS